MNHTTSLSRIDLSLTWSSLTFPIQTTLIANEPWPTIICECKDWKEKRNGQPSPTFSISLFQEDPAHPLEGTLKQQLDDQGLLYFDHLSCTRAGSRWTLVIQQEQEQEYSPFHFNTLMSPPFEILPGSFEKIQWALEPSRVQPLQFMDPSPSFILTDAFSNPIHELEYHWYDMQIFWEWKNEHTSSNWTPLSDVAEYASSFDGGRQLTLTSFRFKQGQGFGRIRIHSIRLVDTHKNELVECTFGNQPFLSVWFEVPLAIQQPLCFSNPSHTDTNTNIHPSTISKHASNLNQNPYSFFNSWYSTWFIWILLIVIGLFFGYWYCKSGSCGKSGSCATSRPFKSVKLQ